MAVSLEFWRALAHRPASGSLLRLVGRMARSAQENGPETTPKLEDAGMNRQLLGLLMLAQPARDQEPRPFVFRPNRLTPIRSDLPMSRRDHRVGGR
jgi:hypothetical protein